MDGYDMHRLLADIENVRSEISRGYCGQQDDLSALEEGFNAIASRLSDTKAGLEFLAINIHYGFEQVIEQLAGSATELDRLVASTERPSENPGTELRNRGLYALEQGWLPEAVDDLQHAVSVFPYDAVTFFALGIAHSREGAAAEAGEAFERAVRYSSSRVAGLTIVAARLAAQAFDRVGDVKRGETILREALKAVPDAAEVAFDLASTEPQMLVSALRLCPELALAARSLRLPSVEQAATTVLSEPDGLARHYTAALQVDRSATETPSDAPLQASPRLPDLPRQASASAQLIALAALLPVASKQLLTLAERASSLAAHRRRESLRPIIELKAALSAPAAIDRAEPREPAPDKDVRHFGRMSLAALIAAIVVPLTWIYGASHYSGGANQGGDLVRALLGLVVAIVGIGVIIAWVRSVPRGIRGLHNAAKARDQYNVALSEYKRQTRDHHLAEQRRKSELEAAQEAANREEPACAQLEELAERAKHAATLLVPCYVKGLLGLPQFTTMSTTEIEDTPGPDRVVRQEIYAGNKEKEIHDIQMALHAIVNQSEPSRYFSGDPFRRLVELDFEVASQEAQNWQDFAVSQLCDAYHIPSNMITPREYRDSKDAADRASYVRDQLVTAGAVRPTPKPCHHGKLI